MDITLHTILEFWRWNFLSCIIVVCLGRNFQFLKYLVIDHITRTLYILSPLLEHFLPITNYPPYPSYLSSRSLVWSGPQGKSKYMPFQVIGPVVCFTIIQLCVFWTKLQVCQGMGFTLCDFVLLSSPHTHCQCSIFALLSLACSPSGRRLCADHPRVLGEGRGNTGIMDILGSFCRLTLERPACWIEHPDKSTTPSTQMPPQCSLDTQEER